jgi:uncharacterized ferritin-like protein (DUF455 family)
VIFRLILQDHHYHFTIRQHALALLLLTDAQAKANAVRDFAKSIQDGLAAPIPQLTFQHYVNVNKAINIPGRPEKPVLVSPLAVKKRAMNTLEGRAALIHALCHIEFNAINLALDALWRFDAMPFDYYHDWLNVADEESYHFTLLNQHLATYGFTYGDFNGHNSLWEMVDRTKTDVLARMALVPRTMEARGLDASPALRNKLAQAGDQKAAEILDIILRDEIGHVAVGNRWFNWLCVQRNLLPLPTFADLALQYQAPKLRPPFNLPARRQAGFTDQELEILQQ